MLIRTAALTLAGTVVGFTVLFGVLPVPPMPGEATVRGDDTGRTLAIEDVSYFDGERMHPSTTLLIDGGRILSVDAEEVPRDAERIDGSDLTALPGLIDAHVHTWGGARRDALRFGVTTLIDMFTAPANLVGARIAREAYAPTDEAALYSAGMLATAAGGHGTQYGIAVDTLAGPQEATDWVAARLAEGSDFIKLVYMPRWERMPSIDLATARAVIDAAHAAGVMAVAHVATRAGAAELLDAGIDGFVHVFADEPVDEAFLSAARERGVFVIPTLAVIAMASGRSTGPALVDDADLGPRLDPLARSNLRRDFGSVIPGFSLDVALNNVRRLHQAGVPILAGSDAPNPGTAHGVSLHAELALLVRAGLTPAQALAAATSVPARIFGAEDRGVIAPGARADLVLVAGRPAQDIRGTRAVQMILRNGHPMRRDGDGATDQTDTAVASAAPVLPDSLGDFDAGIDAPPGLIWAPTSDTMMGGSSAAELVHLSRGEGGALGIDAVVAADFAYPWAGAYLGAGSDDAVADISKARAISFEVRGTPASYRLMLFQRGSLGAPPTVEFDVGEDWRRVEIALAQFGGFTPALFTGMAFVTPMRSGAYAFAIDEVRLVQ